MVSRLVSPLWLSGSLYNSLRATGAALYTLSMHCMLLVRLSIQLFIVYFQYYGKPPMVSRLVLPLWLLVYWVVGPSQPTRIILTSWCRSWSAPAVGAVWGRPGSGGGSPAAVTGLGPAVVAVVASGRFGRPLGCAGGGAWRSMAPGSGG